MLVYNKDNGMGLNKEVVYIIPYMQNLEPRICTVYNGIIPTENVSKDGNLHDKGAVRFSTLFEVLKDHEMSSISEVEQQLNGYSSLQKLTKKGEFSIALPNALVDQEIDELFQLYSLVYMQEYGLENKEYLLNASKAFVDTTKNLFSNSTKKGANRRKKDSTITGYHSAPATLIKKIAKITHQGKSFRRKHLKVKSS